MTTVFDVLVETGRHLEAMVEGAATAGAVGGGDFTDSNLVTLGYAKASFFKAGTAFIIKTSDGLAPQGQSRVISDSDTAGKITLASVFSAQVEAGDWYGLMTNRFYRQTLIGKLNQALAEIIGDVPVVDTSLVTASGQREYTLPEAVKRDLRVIELAQSTVDPWDWEPILTARVEWAAEGTGPKLIFPYQPRVGFKIKLVYMTPHGQAVADTDLISKYISKDWLALETAARCAMWRTEQPGADAEKDKKKINTLVALAHQAARRRRVGNWPSASQNLFPYTGL